MVGTRGAWRSSVLSSALWSIRHSLVSDAILTISPQRPGDGEVGTPLTVDPPHNHTAVSGAWTGRSRSNLRDLLRPQVKDFFTCHPHRSDSISHEFPYQGGPGASEMPFHSEELNWIDLTMLERASRGTGLAPGDLQQGRLKLISLNAKAGRRVGSVEMISSSGGVEGVWGGRGAGEPIRIPRGVPSRMLRLLLPRCRSWGESPRPVQMLRGHTLITAFCRNNSPRNWHRHSLCCQTRMSPLRASHRDNRTP